MSFSEFTSQVARDVPESGIIEIVNRGRLINDLIPLWVGEGDLPTPPSIYEAASRSLEAGETFYTWQRGIPPLREALSGYYKTQYSIDLSPEKFIVTNSGMHAIILVLTALVGPGKSIIVPTPTWPNLAAAAQASGAEPVCVPMVYDDAGWSLSIEDIEAAIRPDTTAIFFNTPSNPTGWVADEKTIRAILELARRRGLWIIADEVYGRFYFGDKGPRAPSLLNIAMPEDRIVYVNTFSKNWAMTGWRVGWLIIPEELGQMFENLVQYSTSGVPVFIQRSAVAALRHGETFLEHQLQQVRQNFEFLQEEFSKRNRISMAPPEGAFYALFRVEGFENSRDLAMQLLDDTGIGLAPGNAFGPGAEAFCRICVAMDSKKFHTAVARLLDWLDK